MFERTFTVKYLTLKKCFCYISDKQTRAIDQGSAVKLSSGTSTFYFTVGSFLGNLKETEIGINGIYAKALGLKEKDPVIFSLCSKPIPGVKTLDITPPNKDDYEILELMANDVQSTLLNQLRIVQNNQKVVIWISNSLNVIVNVDGVKPVSPGRLDQLTEVVIKPPVVHTNPKKVDAKENGGGIWSINGFLKYFAPNKPVQEESILDIYKAIGVPFVFRLHPLADVLRCPSPNLANNTSKNVFNVYASKNVLPRCVEKREDLVFSFRPILPPRDFKYTDDNDAVNDILVRLCLLDDTKNVIGDGNEYFKPLFVDEGIFKHYDVEVGSKVLLRHIDKVEEVNKIEICTSKGFVKEIKEKFKFYIGENCKDGKLILNSNFVINISDEHQVLLKFTPNDLKSCFVDSDFIRNGQLTVGELQLPDFSPKVIDKIEKFDEICLDFSNFKEILDGCYTCWNIGCKDINNLENILITGKPGCGKSTLAQEFSKKISTSPIYIHVETISCKEIKGKTVDSLHKFFEGKFMKLVYYQPSLLILDDLHVICENVIDGAEPTQQSLLFNRTSEILASLFNDLLKKHFIQIIATAESTLKLNKNIFDSRGVHFFKNIFTIKELNKLDRINLLKFAFEKDTNIEDVDLENLSLKTEGYVAQDLVDLVNKCIFESYKDELATVNNDHCLKALEASSSLSLRNVQLHTPGNRDFSDIGGLEDVKKILIESMLWPAQYANIFANAPLRLQSGLLLYGPPGTGKTILAGAAAKQCNLRLISIKGPELLSKYIGASEQAVRDVFEKAQSAKPCILFFDEFDSLAPRRGHDNTGVTDRVVNQFLTQLDGVESLTGVCVLAATSRPDLLDPALLRPGRLDKQILCPLPDQPARLAILKSLSKTLNFSNDVDLGEIASTTHGFSGADLQAVLYTAQMSAVEHLLDDPVDDEDVDDETEINQGHLKEALKTTRPSLTLEDRRKYDRIYAKFQANEDLLELQGGKQRATLA
ncbi:peroxisomal ATPase PEX1 isoform X1 [Onthophagus taurus]|uniref:peroxisomal ATPase PEX1 isoform X1 n=1 Tax=Onthophagus taurus TaxID=166361 RepID=UPI0039BDF929